MAENTKYKSLLEIMVPYREGTPLYPSVKPTDRIIDAVELMVSHDLRQVVLASDGRIFGMVRLEDALVKLGIRTPFETV